MPQGVPYPAMEQRLSMITLGVADLNRSRAFYQALGWTVHPSSQDAIAFFKLRGMVLGLYGRAALAADAQLPDAPCPFGGITLSYNVRSREEADQVMAEAERAGARVLKAPQEVFWGGYSGYFADPDGHPWEVAHNPFWTLADDGSVQLSG